MNRALASALGLLFATVVGAGDALTGTLSQPHFMSDGYVVVSTSGTRSSVPSCAATSPSRFAFDATTASGKAQLAGLLTAYASHLPVRILGTGDCAWGSEKVSYFYIDQ